MSLSETFLVAELCVFLKLFKRKGGLVCTRSNLFKGLDPKDVVGNVITVLNPSSGARLLIPHALNKRPTLVAQAFSPAENHQMENGGSKRKKCMKKEPRLTLSMSKTRSRFRSNTESTLRKRNPCHGLSMASLWSKSTRQMMMRFGGVVNFVNLRSSTEKLVTNITEDCTTWTKFTTTKLI